MFGQIEFSDPLCIIKMPDICQLKCRYCFRQYNKKPELIKYSGQDVMQLLRHYPKIRTVSFLGGEPLLFKDKIKEIILATKPRIKKYIITTNGLNLKAEDVQFYVDNHVQLNISLDGDRELNDFNRGKGTFDKVISAIETLRKNSPSEYFWVISSTFSKETINCLFETYLFIRTITPKGWAVNIDKYGRWTDEDLKIISQQLRMIQDHYLKSPRTMKWFLSRIGEHNIIYNHSDHVVIHQSGLLQQGFPFSKEILFTKNFKNMVLGDIFNIDEAKPYNELTYEDLRPCNGGNCKHCPLGERKFYQDVQKDHARLLCTIYRTLMRLDEKEDYNG